MNSRRRMIKKILKSLLTSSGYTVYKNDVDPSDSYVQQKSLFDTDALTIFDIGANKGNTVIKYKNLFPKSTIYAFEPHPEAYKQLVTTTKYIKDVHSFKLGIGNITGQSSFYTNTFSETSSLLQNDIGVENIWGVGAMVPSGVININISTLDDFLETRQIPVIDILKMDTQGTEYQIIEGAHQTLSQNVVRLIYAEIITLPTYIGQKGLYEFIKMLEKYSFEFYGLYNPFYVQKKLASADVIFIHRDF